MGYDAAALAKAGICILLALVVGFFGSLYVGAKYLDSSHGPAARPIESKEASQSPPVARDPDPPSPSAQATPDTGNDRTITPQTRSAPEAGHAGREPAVTESRDELRLGRQERRRLRAERRKSLENANGRMQKPQTDTRRHEEPFFPFRQR